MRIDYFEVMLDKNPDVPYLAGESINGRIEMTVQERVRIARLTVRLLGEIHTSWRSKADEVVYESKELIIDEYIDLTNDMAVHCSDDLEINVGQHTLNFQIAIPYDVESTIKQENYGSVNYTCSAILDIPEDGESEIISEKEVLINSLLNLDAPHFRQIARGFDQVNIYGCCCRRPKGWFSTELIIGEMGLLPGETVKIRTVVDSSISKKKSKKHEKAHDCALLSLCQQVTFKAADRMDKSLIDEKCLTMAVHSEGTCRSTQSNGPATQLLAFKIPEGLPPTSTKANGLITCSYFFKLDMEYLDIIVPVVIGSVKTMDPNSTASV